MRKKLSVIAISATAACLAAVGMVGVGPAGASPTQPSFHAGTYNWFVNGSDVGTITFASGHVWSSSYISATGSWMPSGTSFGMMMDGGQSGSGGCTFAGVKNSTGVGTAAHPGKWVCPGYDSSGTWYVGPAGAPSGHAGNVFEHAAFSPLHGIVPGTYEWFLLGNDAGTITFAANNTFTSTVDEADSGTWVQQKHAVALYITSGEDAPFDCIYTGTANAAGTAINSSANPGKFICSTGANSVYPWYVS